MSELRRKCPLCGGELVRSRHPTLRFWKRPWKRRLLDWGDPRVFSWACMGCGVVLFYLEKLPALSEESKTARAGSVTREAQPAHLKS